MRVQERAKPRLFVAGVFAVALALPGSVSAQLLNYSGYTNGCFGAGCTLVDSNGAFQFATLTMPNSTLRYANSTFNGTVNAGDLFLLTSAATSSFQQQLNNLGAFYLTMTGLNQDTYSDFFTLALRFVDPGSGLGLFTATLSGSIRVGQASPNNVVIEFDTPGQAVSWSNPLTGQSGTIDITLSERVMVIAGTLNQTSRARVGGEGIITVVPEPMSMILLGSGLLGVAGVARRRRRATDDAGESV